MISILNQDDKQCFFLLFLPLFLIRTNVISSSIPPSVLMNANTWKRTNLDTDPSVKKLLTWLGSHRAF